MEPQFYKFVNNELGILHAFVKWLWEDEDVINIDDDWDTPPVKEFSQMLSQSIEREGRVLHTEAKHFELINLSVPNETKILRVAGVNCDMIVC